LIWGVPKLLNRDDSKGPSPRSSTDAEQLSPLRPPPSKEEAARPLGTPAHVPAGAGKYELQNTPPGDPSGPVAIDPTRPIHYAVNLKGAPADGLSLVQQAVARVQSATGLHFINDGDTNEVPTNNREPYQPKRYSPDRWAPVLIAWENENEFPELAGYIT